MGDRKLKPIAWLMLCILAVLPLLTACDLPQVSAEDRIFLNLKLDFLSEFILPATQFQDTPIGGLSGITYDRHRNVFYAISDDRGDFAPARFYTLKLNLDTQDPKASKIQSVTVEGVTSILDDQGQTYAKGTVDPEDIDLSPLDTLFISSEGVAGQEIAPFIREYELKTGQLKRSLPVPERYRPKKEAGKLIQGVGENLGFEALTLGGISPGAIEPFRLFTATESALTQDVSPEHPQQGASRNRWLHYTIDPDHSLLVSEQMYVMDPPPEGAQFHGLTDILAIDQGGHFLSLERSFGSKGFAVKLFQLSIGNATDTVRIDTFQGTLPGVQPIRKKLLLDLGELGIRLDNLEGMTLGPQLPDGSRSLLLISDNNFNPLQINQFLLFRLQGKI